MNLKIDLKNYAVNALLGLGVIFIYFLIPRIEIPFLEFFNLSYSNVDTIFKIIYVIIWEILTACIISLILIKKLNKDVADIKKNHKEYFSKYFKYWLISVAVMMFSNLLIGLINSGDIASNEKAIRDMFKISPFYIFFSSVIYAPIVEEFVFRQGIRNIIPNKILFILVSGLIFGGLHVISGYSSPIDLLYLIPYSAPGIAFAYILADSDNILISTGLHFMHNGILVAMQFMLLFFS